MNPITPILLALVTGVLLILLGYWLHGRLDQAASPLAAPTAVGVPGTQSTWFSRAEAVEQLRALRDELETGGEFGKAQALLLFDCCAFLGFDEGEVQAVIGAAWFDAIEEPADLDLEEEN